MAKLIIGITGEIACGKGTITKHLVEEHGAFSHRFSSMLRDVLDRLYIDQTRENIATLSLILRKNFGEDIMAKTMMKEVERDQHDIVVIDGVRRLADIKYMQKLPHFKLVYIDAKPQIRYERLTHRRENTDDATKTFEEFMSDEHLESEEQIRDLKNYADFVIDNDGDYVNLYAQVEKIIKENVGE